MSTVFHLLPVPPDPPSPATIRRVMRAADLDRRRMAALAGVSVRTLDRWTGPDDGGRWRFSHPPRGLWHLLHLLEAGISMTNPPADPPSAELLRAWIGIRGLSQYRLAQLLDEDLRKIQSWCAPGRAAPYWLWHALRRLDIEAEAGVEDSSRYDGTLKGI